MTTIMLGLMTLLAGITLLSISRKFIAAENKTNAWPKAIGRITRSEVEEKKDDVSTSYIPCIAYEYTVAGVSYTGNRIGSVSKPFGYSSKAEAESLIAPYPCGPTYVYYRSDSPKEALLEVGVSGFSTMLRKIGFAAIIIGLGLLGYGIRVMLA